MPWQGSLGFARITADEARKQRERIAAQIAALPPAAPKPPPPPKRPVGKPKQQRELVAAQPATPLTGSRGQYTTWFTSPYINDVLAAFRNSGKRAKVAVHQLQSSAPDDRYARLTHSTINAWFYNGELLPHLQKQLEAQQAPRGIGNPRAFAAAPLVEAEIKLTLLRMREAGTPLNSRIIRIIMQAIVQEKLPSLQLTFSQKFISSWVRRELLWTWRARTTAASKLPADWEAQGIKMAMRIAACMGMHEVSERDCAKREEQLCQSRWDWQRGMRQIANPERSQLFCQSSLRFTPPS